MQPAVSKDAEESHCVAKSIRAICFFWVFILFIERRTKEASCMGALVALLAIWVEILEFVEICVKLGELRMCVCVCGHCFTSFGG